MNIRPLYDRIVVKRIEEQETTRHGIIIPDSAKEKPQEGEVIAVGHGKRMEDGQAGCPRRESRRPHPLFRKVLRQRIYARWRRIHIIMREEDVLGVLNGGAKSPEESRLDANRSTNKEIIYGKTDYL